MTTRPILISSWNGAPAVSRAAELHHSGTPLLEAIVAGVGLVEDDPTEMSVGFGGLPNEDGEVELDAAVMHGPLHRAGAVAGLRRIRRAAAVALEVLRRTDHALLVGEGALAFARKLGFPEEDLRTEESRKAWLDWKSSLSSRDAWLAPDQPGGGFGQALGAGHKDSSPPGGPPPGVSNRPATAPFTYGTIHVSGLDAAGDMYSCTSTSGLSYKIAGRVGDSPIVGAGIFTDNAIGSAGATGRGEAALHSCAAASVVARMEAGDDPERACLHVLKKIAERTREKRLQDAEGRPNFNVTLYALRKDGSNGAASMRPGYQYIVWDGATRTLKAASLFNA